MSAAGFEIYDPTPMTGDLPPDQNSSTVAQFTGRAGELADLSIRTTMLTILTLGIYRFWMKTNLRRYYWASIRADGEPLEYTGKGSELFLGFLLAMVILTVYLAVVTIGLAYAGMAIFERPEMASLTAVAIVPLIPIAIYRARRYLLSRTRWRGIRFGVEAGSWGYAARYFLSGVLTLLSLGLLYTLMQFQLAKFAANRTWFGNLRMTQGGSWTGLLAAWIPVVVLMVIGVGGFALLALTQFAANAAQDPAMQEGAERLLMLLGPLLQHPLVAVAAPFSPILFVVALLAYLWYRVYSFRYLSSHKYFGDKEIRFRSGLGFWSVVGIYLTGVILSSLVMLGVMMLIGAIVVGGLFATGVGFNFDSAALESGMAGLEDTPIAFPLMVAGMALGYLIIILVAVACGEVFFVRRLVAKACRTLTIFNIERARSARQRAHDSNIEGQGFADALDIGGAF